MKTQNNEVAVAQSNTPMNAFSSVANFEAAQRMAQVFATSDFVPDSYKGKIGNCMIAMNMANRMGADPIMTMQNLYVVHGNPSWSTKFLVACFNQCGRFTPIAYESNVATETDKNKWYCIAKSTVLATGEEVHSAKVTWQMVEAEGWSKKNGSKWLTMPEVMFQYRAAAFLIRTTAPEISMGFYTQEEVTDGVKTFDVEATEVKDEPKSLTATTEAPAQAEVPQDGMQMKQAPKATNIFDNVTL